MPRLEIELDGHLLVGGTRSAALGIDASTARRFHQGRWVPCIPATAVRGAVRMQLEALLAGTGKTPSQPYPENGDSPVRSPGDEPVGRLFGQSGPLRARSGAYEGALRFGDALPLDPVRACRALAVRAGVEIDDHRSAAAEQKLYFREVAETADEPLVFSSRLDVGDAREDDLRLLRAAVATTEAVGAGKSHGGGIVRMAWRESDERCPIEVTGEPSTARRARVTLRLVEPAHFGDGGPVGNHHATRLYLPGATLRGAVAFALLRNGVTDPETSEFQATFLAAGAASFGDGLPVPHRDLEPVVGSITKVRSRGATAVTDRLAGELARERVNRTLRESGSGRRLRSDAGEQKLDRVSPRPDPGLLRRSRTRVSIDRHTLTAAEGRLFTIEQLEAWCEPGGSGPRPVHLVSWIEGLTPQSARLLARLDGLELLVGGRRNHGLGLVEGEIRFFDAEPDIADARSRVEALASEIDGVTGRLAARAGLEPPAGSPERVPLALTAISDFVPGAPDSPETAHPLAGLAPEAGAPVRTFAAAALSGGYDQRPAKHRARPGRPPEPLKQLLPAIGAGSVFVYEVPASGLDDLLRRIVPELRRGVGERVDSGCGRFEVFRRTLTTEAIPAGDDPAGLEGEESMNVEPDAELKRWLVEEAEKIADKTPSSGDSNQATSQLRSLLQITQRESEVKVLANFIRYQAARRASRSLWEPIHSDVIAVLEQIEQKAGNPELRRAAIQHFFGYLVRCYVYRRAFSRPARGGAREGARRHAR